MNKIMIIGCSGAGKTTLARTLQEITGLPLIHLDQQYWKPNWIASDKGEWKNRMEELVKEEMWILDGNYGGTMEIRLKKADTIIFLQYSRWLCLYRVLKRYFQHVGKVRPDMPQGCAERWDWDFLKYVYNYEKKKTPQVYERLKKVSTHTKILIFKHPRETKHFIASMRTKYDAKPDDQSTYVI